MIMQDPENNATLIELDSLDWRYTSSVNATISRIAGIIFSSQLKEAN